MISGFRAGLSTRGLHRFKGHVERSTRRCAGRPLPGPLCFHWRRTAETTALKLCIKIKTAIVSFFCHEFLSLPLLSSESRSLLNLNQDKSERELSPVETQESDQFISKRGAEARALRLWSLVTWIFDEGKKFL